MSWQDLRAAAGGRLSPRTFGFILRDLEQGQQATLVRIRDPEYGVCYRYDPEIPFDAIHQVAKADGPDAKRNPPRAPEDNIVVEPEEDSEPVVTPEDLDPSPEEDLDPLRSLLADDGVDITTILATEDDLGMIVYPDDLL